MNPSRRVNSWLWFEPNRFHAFVSAVLSFFAHRSLYNSLHINIFSNTLSLLLLFLSYLFLLNVGFHISSLLTSSYAFLIKVLKIYKTVLAIHTRTIAKWTSWQLNNIVVQVMSRVYVESWIVVISLLVYHPLVNKPQASIWGTVSTIDPKMVLVE